MECERTCKTTMRTIRLPSLHLPSRRCFGNDSQRFFRKWSIVRRFHTCLHPTPIIRRFPLPAWLVSHLCSFYTTPQTSLIPYLANVSSMAFASETLGSTTPLTLFRNAIREDNPNFCISSFLTFWMSRFLTCDHPNWNANCSLLIVFLILWATRCRPDSTFFCYSQLMKRTESFFVFSFCSIQPMSYDQPSSLRLYRNHLS